MCTVRCRVHFVGKVKSRPGSELPRIFGNLLDREAVAEVS